LPDATLQALLEPRRLLLLLGLSFFFGLAFEGYHHDRPRKPPGGIRSFPLLALLGAGLYVLEPASALAFIAGLLVIGAWLAVAPWLRPPATRESEADAGGSLAAPLCNLVAYLLGPITLLAPTWFPVGLTVAAVLLLTTRERLHRLADRIPSDEIITLGKFLVLTGIVLPLLPDEPVTSWLAVTPHQAWLAVVAVSALSYASYLVQRYAPFAGGTLLAAVLGGLYSSTATTVVMARRLVTAPAGSSELQAGIVLATGLMYLRMGVIIAIFDLPLAKALATPLAILLLLAVLLALLLLGGRRGAGAPAAAPPPPHNPLELTAALIFAVTFLLVSLAAGWVKANLGEAGLLWLAGIIGIADIDPFVLSIVQGGVPGAPLALLGVAVLVAASSNDLLKAIYTLGFSGDRRGWAPAAALLALAAAGFAIAGWVWAKG
jgi:uncharacterized membrane protein (DUF4010 family)